MTELITAPDISTAGGLVASSVFPVTDSVGATLYKATGAEIAAAYGGGGGGVIIEVVADGSSNSLNIGSIPAGYKSMRIQVAGAAGGNMLMTFNGDSGANYSTTRQYFGIANGSDQVSSGTSFSSIADFSGTSAPAPSLAQINVLNYTDPTFYKSMTFSSRQATTAGTISYTIEGSGQWASLATVNQVTAVSSSGNWAAGTTMRVFLQ